MKGFGRGPERKGGNAVKDEERELCRGLRAGNPKAYRQLLDRYTPYVWAVVRNIAGGKLPQAELEDLAAEVFAGIWRGREGLREEGSLRGYLAACARNAAWDALRQGSVPLEELPEEMVDVDPSPGEAAERRELLEAVESALEGLDPEDRRILRRHYFAGETLASMAREMKIGEGALRVRMHRVRRALREELKKRGITNEN